jgi:hypothetical protein
MCPETMAAIDWRIRKPGRNERAPSTKWWRSEVKESDKSGGAMEQSGAAVRKI